MRARSVRFVNGFTLIEVLVAVFVLAVGVIGAAGTQLVALRMRHGSALMSGGVQLAAALAERMRANTVQMQLSDAANAYLEFKYSADDGPPPAPATLCYSGAGCSSVQLARFDLYEVASALHQAFPGGRVAVCRDAAAWNAASQALSWECAGGVGAPLVIKLGWRGKRASGADDDSAAGPGQFAPAVAMLVSGAGQ